MVWKIFNFCKTLNDKGNGLVKTVSNDAQSVLKFVQVDIWRKLLDEFSSRDGKFLKLEQYLKRSEYLSQKFLLSFWQ